MGNGASVGANNSRISNFSKIEELVEKRFFLTNIVEYKQAVEECIKLGEMDILEILIPAGDTKKILPLHIAARNSSIEACELLLSAGFDYLATDVKGYTPLHYCPLSQLDDANLCTTLLGLLGPKAVNIRDKRFGNTPLHIAVEANNINCVQTLLAVKKINPNLSNFAGETPLRIAKRLRYDGIVKVLDPNDESLKKNDKRNNLDNPVDQERIMKVWEAFFENAFKHMESQSNAAEGFMVDKSGYDAVQERIKTEAHGSDCHNLNEKQKINQRAVDKFDFHSNKKSNRSLNDESKTCAEDYEEDVRVSAWLNCILCYEAASGLLYAINVLDGTSAWLEDHLYSHQYWYGLIPSYWEDIDSYYVLPTNTVSLVTYGWITYYDSISNSTCWYNIPSKHSVTCLPIGNDPLFKSSLRDELGMIEFEGSNEWRMSSHSETVRYSWVYVIITNYESANDHKDQECKEAKGDSEIHFCYYLNQITNHTTWTPPEDWDYMINEMWYNLILCINEEDPSALFWWNPDTLQSIWVESVVRYYQSGYTGLGYRTIGTGLIRLLPRRSRVVYWLLFRVKLNAFLFIIMAVIDGILMMIIKRMYE